MRISNARDRVLLAVVLFFCGHLATAATVTSFSDSFDADAPGLSATALLKWTATNGSVDVIAHGTYSIDCQGSGNCIDLDGSSSDGGDLSTNDNFAVGTYTLRFDLSGSQRSGSDTVRVVFGDLDEEITLNAGAPWMMYEREVIVNSEGALTFSQLGGDNVGLMLDNVSVSAVPLPGALIFTLTALPGLLVTKRRRA